MSARKCKLCDGIGHDVKGCATLKNMNNAVKNLPQPKILWGRLKFKYIKFEKTMDISNRSKAILDEAKPVLGTQRTVSSAEALAANVAIEVHESSTNVNV